MFKKLFLPAGIAAAAIVLFACFKPTTTKTVAEKPDILFFLADDMTSVDCEPYGNPDVKTPNLAKLASEGLCFDNMNNATAMCGPTRQSLYTGIYPVKNGSYPNHAQTYDNIISVVQHFTSIGYRVALIGKQHYAPAASFPFEYLGGRNSDNGEGQDINLDNAQTWINKDKTKPFLLIVATNQPHGPWNRGNPAQYKANKLTVPPYMVDTKETRKSLVAYYAEITYAKLYRNRPEFELYNIKTDKYELNNLVADAALQKIKDNLFTELKSWMKEQGGKGMETEWLALTRFKGDTTKWRNGND